MVQQAVVGRAILQQFTRALAARPLGIAQVPLSQQTPVQSQQTPSILRRGFSLSVPSLDESRAKTVEVGSSNSAKKSNSHGKQSYHKNQKYSRRPRTQQSQPKNEAKLLLDAKRETYNQELQD